MKINKQNVNSIKDNIENKDKDALLLLFDVQLSHSNNGILILSNISMKNNIFQQDLYIRLFRNIFACF